MIKQSKLFSSILGIIFLSASQVKADDIFLADPTIYQENGTYYMTGTGNGESFVLYTSTDLKTWKSKGSGCPCSRRPLILKGRSTYGTTGFWAPQIFKDADNSYYMAYCANEQIAITKSGSPYGPFKQTKIEPMDDSQKNIDPFIFKDDDGKYYMYQVRFNNGNYLWGSQLDIKNGKIDLSKLKQCFYNTQPWENTDTYPSAPIMEGPTVIKIEGTYYLFYSANHYMSADYAVGYATSSHPLGPWKKYANNPIISKNIVGDNGSGHGDIFQDVDGKYYYVYHTHFSNTVVHPRRTKIVPLIFTKNESTGLYDISVDKDNIITPIVQ